MRIIIGSIAAGLLFSLIFIPFSNVDALSCGIPKFSEEFENHDLLLHGILVQKEFKFTEEPEDIAVLTFEPITVYKGNLQERYEIEANLYWDDIYQEGEQYVLFADNIGDEYIRELCVGNYLASPLMIEFLDAFSVNPKVDFGVSHLYDLEHFSPQKLYEDSINPETYTITTDQAKYKIPYQITSGTVDEIFPNCDSQYVVFHITANKGELIIDIPRALLDSKLNDKDDEFFIILDGEDIESFTEIRHENSRKFQIPLIDNSKELEIIGSISWQNNEIACDVVHNPPYSFVLPPLKQLKNGISTNDVICKEGYELIFRSTTSIACVTSETAEKLIERGWSKTLDSQKS